VRRTPLASVAALVRFAEDPKLLAIEWADGAPPSCYVSPARNGVLAALLDAAQGAAGRALAVMPGFTSPGDVVVTERKAASHAPHTEGDPDLERLYVGELSARGRQAHPALTAFHVRCCLGGQA
jgi:DnaJ family protein C protein 13